MSDSRQIDSDRFIKEVMKRVMEKDFDGNLQAWGDTGGGYWQSKPNLSIDRYSLKSLLYESDWVFIVNNLVATKISNQRLVVLEKEVVAGETILRPAQGHELQELLDRPNDRESQSTLTYNWVIDLTLGGNGLVYHAPKFDTLHNIPFERVQPDFDSVNGVIKSYLFESDQSTQAETMAKVTVFPVDDVMHAMKPNPSNSWWGLSPFIPGRASVLFNKYSSEFLNSFYLKGATPQLALEMDADVNEKSALRMLRSFEKAYGGRENQRRPLVTPKGVKATPLTTTLADQQLITYINSNRETLINLLSIPKHELSIQEGGGLGSQEMRLSLRNFWLTTLKPTMRQIEGSLNNHFKERLGPNHIIAFDMSTIEALQDDEIKKAELADRLVKSGVLTPNEVRKKVFKMDEHPDGDMLMGVQGRGLQQEPAPVIEPGERPSDNEPIRALLDGSTKEAVDYLRKEREREEEKPKSSMSSLAESMFARFLELLVPAMKETLSDVVSEEAGKQIKAASEEELNSALKKLNKKLTVQLKPFEKDFTEQYSKVNSSAATAGHSNIIAASFSPQIASEIQALATPASMEVLLKARGIKSFEMINKTQTEMALTQVRDGMQSNKSLTAITRSVVTNLGENSEARAQRIARTEVGMATMLGRESAWRDAKAVVGDIKKVWITAGDDRVRDGSYGNGDHVSLDNVEADKNGNWTTAAGNTLGFPLDPSAPPEERINCRCDMIFIEDL